MEKVFATFCSKTKIGGTKTGLSGGNHFHVIVSLVNIFIIEIGINKY
jgi:hypothetical protein